MTAYKAKVETAVLHIERQVLAKIRNQQFFSIEELNKTLWVHLDEVNQAPFQKMAGSRFSLYQELDKPAIKALPLQPYELAYWEKCSINGSYHVTVKGHSYSVPHKYVKQTVEIRYNQKTVEIFFKGKIIAIHERSNLPGGFSTNPNHRPHSHKHYADLCPEKLLEMANKIGESTTNWIEKVLYDKSKHIRQQEKICLGVLRLCKTYGKDRLEKACQRGLHYQAFSHKNILSILKNNLDQQPIQQEVQQMMIQEHENIRGAEYYDNSLEVLC